MDEQVRELREVLARVYCEDKHSKKTVDVELLESIVQLILKDIIS